MKKNIKFLFFALFIIIVSCQNDDAAQVYSKGSNEYTNQWMYEQMKRYYYWADELPAKSDISLAPNDYFNSLLHSNDRFSYALNRNDGTTFPKSLRNSFGLDIAFAEHYGQVYGIVLYVLSDSPAKYVGLKRGQLIKAINGIPLNVGNYNQLYKDISISQNAQLQVMDYSESEGFSQPQQFNIYSGMVLLQPVSSKVLQVGTHKVGYIQIPHFDAGLSASLLSVFTQFKSELVNEVVVDLRYNGGGDVSSATALCTLLAPSVTANELFIKFKGNTNGGEVRQTFKEALEMNEYLVSFEALRNAHPSIQRVFVLCGSHTGSASEIIINNLRPFIEVITIGEKTVGKDVATFAIEDNHVVEGENQWVLYPAIYKLYNSNNEGNYNEGITPSIILNELRNLEIHALGEQDEILLSGALAIISGNLRLNNSNSIKVLQKSAISDSDPLIINKLVH